MRGKASKRVFFNFLPYECGAAEEYLEAMSEKGWLLQSIKGAFLKFKRIEPKKVKYSVDILQKVSVFDHEDSDAALEYREYCQAAGWNYVCEKGKVQVFYSENSEKIIPIHTDEKEKFKSVIKASLYPVGVQVLFTLLFIFNLYMQLFLGAADFTLGTNLGILSVVTMFSVILINSVEIIGFLFWLMKAEWIVRKSKPMPYNNYKQIRIKNILNCSYGLLLLLMFLKLLIFGKQGDNGFKIGVLVIMCIIIIISTSVQRLINKKKYSKDTNMAISIGGSVASICIGMVIIMNLAFWCSTNSEQPKVPTEKVHLTLMDYGYKESEVTNPYINFDESILAQRMEYSSSGRESELNYTIFQSQYDSVIKFDESRLLNRLKRYGTVLKKEDTNLPGNIKVYKDSMEKVYVLVSEDSVVEIRRDFTNITEDEFLNIVYKKLLS